MQDLRLLICTLLKRGVGVRFFMDDSKAEMLGTEIVRDKQLSMNVMTDLS